MPAAMNHISPRFTYQHIWFFIQDEERNGQKGCEFSIRYWGDVCLGILKCRSLHASQLTQFCFVNVIHSYESFSNVWRIYIRTQANPTPYSPYENEMQRAQAADRAQRFLAQINGGRPSGRKSLSDHQLLPVKDHRAPQSMQKNPKRASSHVRCHTSPLTGEKPNIFIYLCHSANRAAVWTLSLTISEHQIPDRKYVRVHMAFYCAVSFTEIYHLHQRTAF